MKYRIFETFLSNPVGSQSHLVKHGLQPEASLAWRWGDPAYEA